MPEGIVDLLESVHIEDKFGESSRHVFTVEACARDLGLEAAAQGPGVADLGQGVDEGKFLNGLTALADPGQNGARADGKPVDVKVGGLDDVDLGVQDAFLHVVIPINVPPDGT